jgi:hypothetical protein
MLTKEQVFDIKGFSKYKISKDGNIYSLKHKKLLKPQKNRKGYLWVTLYNGNKYSRFSIARLMAMVFIRKPKINEQINHKNGIKTDNRIENLEWCSYEENMIHANKNGLIKKYSKKIGICINPKWHDKGWVVYPSELDCKLKQEGETK